MKNIEGEREKGVEKQFREKKRKKNIIAKKRGENDDQPSIPTTTTNKLVLSMTISIQTPSMPSLPLLSSIWEQLPNTLSFIFSNTIATWSLSFYSPLSSATVAISYSDSTCCNPFLGPHIKNNKIQKNSKNILSKKYNSEKMPERPKNVQKLIEDVQKYKN